MSAVARRLFLVRRQLGERWALLVLFGLWPLLGMGLVSGPALWQGRMLPLAVVTMFGLTLMLAVSRELWPQRGVARDARFRGGALEAKGRHGTLAEAAHDGVGHVVRAHELLLILVVGELEQVDDFDELEDEGLERGGRGEPQSQRDGWDPQSQRDGRECGSGTDP